MSNTTFNNNKSICVYAKKKFLFLLNSKNLHLMNIKGRRGDFNHIKFKICVSEMSAETFSPYLSLLFRDNLEQIEKKIRNSIAEYRIDGKSRDPNTVT